MAVKVTAWPKTEGLGDEVSVVWVAMAAVTVSVKFWVAPGLSRYWR